jgi:F0F1-type ATP synthase membrane subunit b/b'
MPEEAHTDNADITSYLEVIDRADDELASLKGTYMSQCKGAQQQIKEVRASAREAGINMKAFGIAVKRHRADRKHAKRVAELEEEDREAFEQMVEAMGDFAATPLGEAAIESARPKRGRRREEGLDSLHS